MTELLQKAINQVQALPEDEQDRVARLMLDATETVHKANGEGAVEQRPIWEVIPEMMKDVPEEELDKLPSDGAAEHDHYIYGTPKRYS
ncbi:MAG: hypothetical protein IH820_03015 [Bacteroidetes bacterium]|nr:hypothetical protein [Bacteroidota bacterium]